jgi:hypothetical protein
VVIGGCHSSLSVFLPDHGEAGLRASAPTTSKAANPSSASGRIEVASAGSGCGAGSGVGVGGIGLVRGIGVGDGRLVGINVGWREGVIVTTGVGVV